MALLQSNDKPQQVTPDFLPFAQFRIVLGTKAVHRLLVLLRRPIGATEDTVGTH